jgi:hypothetical protein
MEIEDLLKDAAEWRPQTEMPHGLERRTLARFNRPPLRPIGITRPKSALLATAMAGAVCTLMVIRLGQAPEVQVSPTPESTPSATKTNVGAPETALPNPGGELPKAHKTDAKKPPQATVSKPAPLPTTRRTPRSSQSTLRKPAPRSPLTQRFRVAADNGVVLQERVPVETPVYTPAYYAQPSADGESVQYTPVAVALDDPDVIYSETQQEN